MYLGMFVPLIFKIIYFDVFTIKYNLGISLIYNYIFNVF